MIFQIIEENGVKKIQALTADTGTGAPVGSIIVVCSNILPSGYLGLGVQYDITNYPALYQVLGTDTTPTASALGLPTLSSGQYAIKATSGLTENQQENVLNTINQIEDVTVTNLHANATKIYAKKKMGICYFSFKHTPLTVNDVIATLADKPIGFTACSVSQDNNSNVANNITVFVNASGDIITTADNVPYASDAKITVSGSYLIAPPSN